MGRLVTVLLLLPMLMVGVGTGWAEEETEGSYLIIGRGDTLSEDLEEEVEAAGGTLEATIPQIGIALASSDSETFADDLEGSSSGVRSVVPNRLVQWSQPAVVDEAAISFDDAALNPPDSGDDDWIFDLQWGHDAVNAPEAWELGARGAGVRVAVLDSGIAPNHPDLAPNVNMALAKSFVPGEDADVGPGSFWNHGSHVSGIIAAADNGYGIIGVAPEAEIVPVKVLSQVDSYGQDFWVIAGIVYAADVGADVINMSLGARLSRRGDWYDNGTADPGDDVWLNPREVSELLVAYNRALSYANRMGATIFAAAHNQGVDGDHDADAFRIPAQSPHVISVSATAPIGWGPDPDTNLDVPAPYTNYGQSLIDVAAPGGAVHASVTGACLTPAGRWLACRAFDLVISTRPGGWSWASGASMACAYASGVAALVIGQNGGDMDPARVRAILEGTAEDLGKPGNDDFYGAGRLDAFQAVQ